MLIRDEVCGVITAVSFAAEKRFTAHDAELQAKIATVAAVVVDQQRRLQEVDQLRRSGRLGRPADRLRAGIVEGVADLIRRHPNRLREIRSVLGAVGALCDGATA